MRRSVLVLLLAQSLLASYVYKEIKEIDKVGEFDASDGTKAYQSFEFLTDGVGVIKNGLDTETTYIRVDLGAGTPNGLTLSVTSREIQRSWAVCYVMTDSFYKSWKTTTGMRSNLPMNYLNTSTYSVWSSGGDNVYKDMQLWLIVYPSSFTLPSNFQNRTIDLYWNTDWYFVKPDIFWGILFCAIFMIVFFILWGCSNVYTFDFQCCQKKFRVKYIPDKNRIPIYIFKGVPAIRLRNFKPKLFSKIFSRLFTKPCFGWWIHYQNTHDILWIWRPHYNETHTVGFRIFSTFVFFLFVFIYQQIWTKKIMEFVAENGSKSDDGAPFLLFGSINWGSLVWKFLVVDITLAIFRALHRPILRKISWRPKDWYFADSPNPRLKWAGAVINAAGFALVFGFVAWALYSITMMAYVQSDYIFVVAMLFISLFFLRSVFPGLVINIILYYLKSAYGRDPDLRSNRIFYPMGIPDCLDPFCLNNPYGKKKMALRGGVIPHYQPYQNLGPSYPDYGSVLVNPIERNSIDVEQNAPLLQNIVNENTVDEEEIQVVNNDLLIRDPNNNLESQDEQRNNNEENQHS
eukprot:TRINITY_DN5712_c0_g1_i2.p1 TRINITY_DN5712_c0_g1~~TRINITY_DN5712_c0_g1_i2.p1  ORF type:complete len:580 (-),score=92.00 TRINITY_DN5712_c0_g1_i2:55-1773(-)